jgi:hypothetical protein
VKLTAETLLRDDTGRPVPRFAEADARDIATALEGSTLPATGASPPPIGET